MLLYKYCFMGFNKEFDTLLVYVCGKDINQIWFYLSQYLSTIHQSIYLSISLCMSISLSINLFICLSILPIYCLSISGSICMYISTLYIIFLFRRDINQIYPGQLILSRHDTFHFLTFFFLSKEQVFLIYYYYIQRFRFKNLDLYFIK